MGSVLHGSNYKNKKYHNRPLQWKEIHPCLLHLLHYAVVSPCVVKKNQSCFIYFLRSNLIIWGLGESVTSSRSKRANNNAEHNPKGNQKPQGFIKTSHCVSLVMRLAFHWKGTKKKTPADVTVGLIQTNSYACNKVKTVTSIIKLGTVFKLYLLYNNINLNLICNSTI